jgi:ABC-type glycerol-3-phosphate transport system permease component
MSTTTRERTVVRTRRLGLRWRHRGVSAGRALGLTLVVLVALVPFLYVVSSAVKDQGSLFQYPPEWIPRHLSLRGFGAAIDAGWLGWLGNTMIVAVSVTALKVAFDSMSAYAFAKLSFPGRRPLFVLMLLTVMVPPIALIVPLYFLMRDLGLLGTYWALILPPLANPLGIFMLASFIQGLPGELEQAARVDHASPWQTFRYVILPLVKPGLVVVGLYTFLLQYTNFVWPLVFTPDKQFLTTGLGAIVGSTNGGLGEPDWALITAAALLTMLPITLVFLLFQRQFLSTSLAGAVKG